MKNTHMENQATHETDSGDGIDKSGKTAGVFLSLAMKRLEEEMLSRYGLAYTITAAPAYDRIPFTVDDVIREACAAWGVTVDDFYAKINRRFMPFPLIRQQVAFYCVECCGDSFSNSYIASKLAKDHSTTTHMRDNHPGDMVLLSHYRENWDRLIAKMASLSGKSSPDVAEILGGVA